MESTPSLGLPTPLPITHVTLEHFVPEPVFLEILDDFMITVYPVLPLIHIPSFTKSIQLRRYYNDQSFFRLCLALCAVTVASIPRKLPVYSRNAFKSVTEMVDRACQLLIISRLATNPAWQDTPSMDSMIITVVMALAAMYSGGYKAGWRRATAGWAYASEATNCFCSLRLYRAEGYEKLNVVETEMAKRAFWVLFFVQVHDRLASAIPRTGLSYDPRHTDWEFLMPLEVDDQELETMDAQGLPHTLQSSLSSVGKGDKRPIPIILGFISLIRVFLLASKVLKPVFIGTSSEYDLTSGDSVLPESRKKNVQGVSSSQQTKLDALSWIMKELQMWAQDLPEELKIPSKTSLENIMEKEDCASYEGKSHSRSFQFQIMRANIHVARLHIQSTILEMCLSSFQISSKSTSSHYPSVSQDSRTAVNTAVSNTIDPSVHTMMWELRVNLAKDLLHVVKSFSTATLEANGNSMIIKIRQVAGTLTESESWDNSDEKLVWMKEQNKHYVAQFVEILTSLDQASNGSFEDLNEEKNLLNC